MPQHELRTEALVAIEPGPNQTSADVENKIRRQPSLKNVDEGLCSPLPKMSVHHAPPISLKLILENQFTQNVPTDALGQTHRFYINQVSAFMFYCPVDHLRVS